MTNPSVFVELLVGFGTAATAVKSINPLILIGVLAGLGATFGFLLAFADKRIAVKLNPLIHEVEELLPKGQCGACGFPGCGKYAEAVVENESVAPNLCVPGGSEVAQAVASLTGKVAEEVEPCTARVLCRGSAELAMQRYLYDGLPDCRAAHLTMGGYKACEYGCLGFGNCVKVCKFDAIHMGANGLPVIDQQRCTGCGSCVQECPRNVIDLVPKHAKVIVFCRSQEKAGTVKKQCQVGCLGCGLCAKFCADKAIVMENALPKIDHVRCVDCVECLCLTDKCKTGAIQRL